MLKRAEDMVTTDAWYIEDYPENDEQLYAVRYKGKYSYYKWGSLKEFFPCAMFRYEFISGEKFLISKRRNKIKINKDQKIMLEL